jgi:DNA-binding CsgD family transcriptional regulator
MQAHPGFGTPRFIGREAELDRLRAMLEAARARRGGVALLVGEPGIGKTRLAEELAVYAWLRDVQVQWGRCYEGEGAPAFWPWVQIIRAVVQGREPAALLAELGPGAADIAALVPAVRARLPDLPPPPAVEPDQARFRLFDSITAFLTSAAARQPLVLILDDLHWADAPSLLLLPFLARELRAARLLVVGTCREGAAGGQRALARILADLAREPVVARFPLRGLGEPEVARFIEAVAGRPPPAPLVAAVYQQTEGNPFFVTELVRLLGAEGRLAPVPGAAGPLAIPPTVRAAIGRRLDRLSAACRGVLAVAAVIGREFSLAVLAPAWAGEAGAAPDDRAPLLAALDEALAAHLVAEAPAGVGRYRFAHALIRETLYEELGSRDRARLHRRVGRALEALYGADVEPHLAELAAHFGHAALDGDAEPAIAYAARAGERAGRLLAYEEAARHYRMALAALELGPPADERRRAALLLALGEAQARAGDFEAARASFQRAGAIARRLLAGGPSPAAALLARAALGYGGPRGTLGVVDAALIGWLEEALAALGEADDALRARLLGRLAVEHYHASRRERRLALSHEAVATARRAGDPAALAAALTARHDALWEPEAIQERLAVATELVRLAERVEDKELALRGHEARLLDLLELGEVAATDRALVAHARLADELRQPAGRWRAAVFRAMRALLDGRFAEGERLAEAALALGQRAVGASAAQVHLVQLFWVRREAGRLAELEPAVVAMAERYRATGWLAALAWLYADLGRPDEARRALDEAAAGGLAGPPAVGYWLNYAALLADVCAALGDADRAARLYPLLAPYAGRLVLSITAAACRGAVDRYLGRLAGTLGRREAATRHFEAALALNAAVGARPWLAHTQHDYARLLLAGGRPGDRGRARALLAEAVATAEACGMTRLAEQAAPSGPLLPGRRGAAPAETPAPAGLTAREVEVLGLLAGGHSNKEIAAALAVSVATVERHLVNIYSKIDARGRVDAAAFALRHALAPPSDR